MSHTHTLKIPNVKLFINTCRTPLPSFYSLEISPQTQDLDTTSPKIRQKHSNQKPKYGIFVSTFISFRTTSHTQHQLQPKTPSPNQTYPTLSIPHPTHHIHPNSLHKSHTNATLPSKIRFPTRSPTIVRSLHIYYPH